MNATIKTILLTVLTLSVFAIALVELSGVSQTALFNQFEDPMKNNGVSESDQAKRDAKIKKMPKTILEVPETNFNFGTIKEGDKVRHSYVVKNAGQNPMLISNVQTSCGCTAPSFPKEPILPGAQAEITLEFNSAGKAGAVQKNALIFANSDNAPFSISFEAQVEK
ncbi:MAG: DUF1573 domain-containing protein [Chitinophagaceae bacterium]|nr:DUF1573 domain-containing protein [Chitinophagaceae bacterium]